MTAYGYLSDAEDAPYVLAPKGQRLGIASGLVAVGVGISAAMCLYPWRWDLSMTRTVILSMTNTCPHSSNH